MKSTTSNKKLFTAVFLLLIVGFASSFWIIQKKENSYQPERITASLPLQKKALEIIADNPVVKNQLGRNISMVSPEEELTKNTQFDQQNAKATQTFKINANNQLAKVYLTAIQEDNQWYYQEIYLEVKGDFQPIYVLKHGLLTEN